MRYVLATRLQKTAVYGRRAARCNQNGAGGLVHVDRPNGVQGHLTSGGTFDKQPQRGLRPVGVAVVGHVEGYITCGQRNFALRLPPLPRNHGFVVEYQLQFARLCYAVEGVFARFWYAQNPRKAQYIVFVGSSQIVINVIGNALPFGGKFA